MKKLFAVMLAVMMVVVFMPTMAFAETTVIEISSAEDLEKIGVDANYPLDGNYKLTQNIELSGEWTPIGAGSRSGSGILAGSTPFTGTFDGDGNTITGLTITAANAGDSAIGLFGVVDGGTVQKLNLEGVAISGDGDNVGAAVGLAVGGATIDGVTVSGAVSGADGVGGVVGRMTISGTITGCTNSAAVTAGATAGGIVGKAYYTEADEEMTISDCTNTGDVSTGYAAGGIAGFSAANVSDCTNTAEISAGTEAGGIVGEQTNYGEVSGNANSGTISNTTSGGTAYGGIIGWIRYQNNASYANNEIIVVNGNTNSGTISASGAELGAGGIVGHVYNQAIITGNTNTASSIVGGTFAAGIAGGLQNSDKNLVIANEGISVTNNVSTTELEKISGANKALDAYVNDPSNMVVENNGTEFVAQIGAQKYTSFAAAVAAAETGDTITLLKDTNTGVFVDVGENCASGVTFDLNGKSLNLAPAGGSTNTETNGFRVKYGNSAVVKNGTVTASANDDVKVVFANYGALTLEGITMEHTGTIQSGAKMVYSINNLGDLIVNDSTLTTNVSGADDLHVVMTNGDYGYFGGQAGVAVIDEDSVINGDINIEVTEKGSNLTMNGTLNGKLLYEEETTQVVTVPETKELKDNGDGTFSIVDKVVTPPTTPSTGGGYVSIEKPVITVDDGAAADLSILGTTLTITAKDGYEIVDVTVNGVSKGAVTELKGLKTGDKVVVTTKAIAGDDEAAEHVQLVARSEMSSAKGKKAVKVYWFAEDGSDLTYDGYEIFRSVKRYEGYGKKPFFETEREAYWNTAIEEGTKYYYKVRGYYEVNGERQYSDWSLKAWRTVE